MAPTAFLISGVWPYDKLSCIGRASRILSCGRTVDHVGIAFFDCDDEMIEKHSDPAVAHSTALYDADVSFDYLSDKHPKFQGLDRETYWSIDCKIMLYRINGIDVRRLHDVCLQIARARPYNNDLVRCNPFFGGCWPCACACTRQPVVGQSHCAALSMRAIAAVRSDSLEPLRNDAAALEALGIEHHLCSPRRLVGYTPSSAIRALQRAGIVQQGRAFRDESLPLLPL